MYSQKDKNRKKGQGVWVERKMESISYRNTAEFTERQSRKEGGDPDAGQGVPRGACSGTGCGEPGTRGR